MDEYKDIPCVICGENYYKTHGSVPFCKSHYLQCGTMDTGSNILFNRGNNVYISNRDGRYYVSMDESEPIPCFMESIKLFWDYFWTRNPKSYSSAYRLFKRGIHLMRKL